MALIPPPRHLRDPSFLTKALEYRTARMLFTLSLRLRKHRQTLGAFHVRDRGGGRYEGSIDLMGGSPGSFPRERRSTVVAGVTERVRPHVVSNKLGVHLGLAH